MPQRFAEERVGGMLPLLIISISDIFGGAVIMHNKKWDDCDG
jgi:hypothetical protein